MARFSNTADLLPAGATWIGDPMQAASADRVTGTVFSDQAGTLFIEQSGDGGKNWDLSKSVPVIASTGLGFSEEVLVPTVRLRFTNTAGATQTVFRIFGRFQSAGARP